MRSLGLHATQEDLQEMMTEADEDGSGDYLVFWSEVLKC